ncbi:hypothetical protein A2467_00010 [Candidatus Nomurabacteria bacterium RIFOXYC2_FULL_36_8]|nr:MAG: hypothetical protein UR97_C0007G0035 [Candidatus Nomurabacteria bacterium GW2011_GWE2_36_115]KKP93439.1 MAG: hypothetical protein US00_C0007G0061 [Candidatus Nomurabacteria bacterium GW2011_GWF2_36_126]KKP96557.1 MAG: hypothetical protein US04_C0001G0059 [Candidatus Nomurabacteria bacterium GW2011_GWD2_36_14]KKP99838.1 MAG: hypothetical protein US08_C0001G0521 [Candidatus Nomurabacteria bacterium GW2011_GWF2_36_19]KKQ05122.1 MAG: hypothetical protein US17_C0007G0035 [Candidatus Nomuraba
MSIKRIKHSVIFIIIFFAFSHAVYANLEITEVMYNPEGTDTNREWIKLHNNGSNTITVISGRSDSAWRFSDDVEGTELHLINDELIIDPSADAILASNKDIFISEHPEFNGPVADTSMSLNNASGTVRIWDGSNPRNIVAFKEYPYIDNPIVNEENTNSNIDTSISSSTSGGSSSSSSTPKEVEKVYNIATKIISPKVVTAGVPFIINHNTTGTKKEKIILGKFVWNFGDGMRKEGSTSDPFSYTYQYPGEYVLTLSYSLSSFNISPDATDRLTIKVIPSGIIISSVGTPADPFIEIENNSNYEMSLRGWVVKGSLHSFILPEGMTILSNKKIKLSPKITGFDFNDFNSISIIDGGGQIFAVYPNRAPSRVKYSASQNSNSQDSNGNIVKGESVNNNQLENASQVINLNDLGASAVSSDGLSSLSKGFYAWLGLALVIVVGIASVVLLRRNEEIPDYVEETISAKDMTIIE